MTSYFSFVRRTVEGSTDHGQVDVVLPDDVTVTVGALRDVNRTALASVVA